MVLKKIITISMFLIILSSLVLAADTTANVINSLPELTVTSMNLNPGTSRDIFSFITDDNGNTVSCSYCIEDICYETCRIYAPKTPGIHRINITLNDTINTTVQQLTVFVPGEVQSSSSSGDFEPELPEDNPISPYENENINQSEKLNETTTPREEVPIEENEEQQIDKPERIKEKITVKDILFSVIILGLLGTIMGMFEKKQQKVRKQRHEKIATLGQIFTEEDDE